MALRIAVDLDGVLADLASAYRAVEERLFGGAPPGGTEQGANAAPAATAARPPEVLDAEEPEEETEGTGRTADRRAAELATEARRRDAVWQAIGSTENFWTTLAPLEEGAVRRLAVLAARYGWDVFFVTQRPATRGETVQRQTQRWLAAHGYALPSVLVVRGSRGALAAALDLDYLIDDTPQHCVDVRAESRATPILIVRTPDPTQERTAARLGIAVARSVHDALDLLEQEEARAR